MIIRPTFKATIHNLSCRADKLACSNRWGYVWRPDLDLMGVVSQSLQDKVAFEAQNIRVEDDDLVAEIDFLHTKAGRSARAQYMTGAFEFRAFCCAAAADPTFFHAVFMHVI
jgi:hypothetical protein